MEPEGSLPHSQVHANCLYPEPARSCPYPYILLPENPSKPFGAGIIFLILAHPVYKMWIIQEPKKLALWNKLHFEEKKQRV